MALWFNTHLLTAESIDDEYVFSIEFVVDTGRSRGDEMVSGELLPNDLKRFEMSFVAIGDDDARETRCVMELAGSPVPVEFATLAQMIEFLELREERTTYSKYREVSFVGLWNNIKRESRPNDYLNMPFAKRVFCQLAELYEKTYPDLDAVPLMK
jgi:hypothetical protein